MLICDLVVNYYTLKNTHQSLCVTLTHNEYNFIIGIKKPLSKFKKKFCILFLSSLGIRGNPGCYVSFSNEPISSVSGWILQI